MSDAAKPPVSPTVAEVVKEIKPDDRKRSPHWPHVRNTWIHSHPACAVCGSRDKVEVHHVKPFHLFPDLELNPNNFISLCEPHHLLFGHLMSWSSWNPNCKAACVAWSKEIANRPKAVLAAPPAPAAPIAVAQAATVQVDGNDVA